MGRVIKSKCCWDRTSTTFPPRRPPNKTSNWIDSKISHFDTDINNWEELVTPFARNYGNALNNMMAHVQIKNACCTMRPPSVERTYTRSLSLSLTIGSVVYIVVSKSSVHPCDNCHPIDCNSFQMDTHTHVLDYYEVVSFE